MVLRYLNRGPFLFKKGLLSIQSRTSWEFYAVVQGKALLTLEGEPANQLIENALVVFPAGHWHGWSRLADEPPFERIVFHFSAVPELLIRHMPAGSFLLRNLSPEEVARIVALEQELSPHMKSPTELSLLVFERALLELSILALGGEKFRPFTSRDEYAQHKVEAALTWFTDHLAEGPKLETVAQAVHLSSGHLRRLFKHVLGRSPHRIFTQKRLERAEQLLASSDEKLESVAQQSGFRSAGDFCRVFRSYHNTSPERWRSTKIVSKYRGRGMPVDE